jgi:hypothetical protein
MTQYPCQVQSVIITVIFNFLPLNFRVEFGKLNAQYKTVNVGQVRIEIYFS